MLYFSFLSTFTWILELTKKKIFIFLIFHHFYQRYEIKLLYMLGFLSFKIFLTVFFLNLQCFCMHIKSYCNEDLHNKVSSPSSWYCLNLSNLGQYLVFPFWNIFFLPPPPQVLVNSFTGLQMIFLFDFWICYSINYFIWMF